MKALIYINIAKIIVKCRQSLTFRSEKKNKTMWVTPNAITVYSLGKVYCFKKLFIC